MDSPSSLQEGSYQSDYLHYQFQKFWEIRVYSTNKTLIRCGRLSPTGQEELSSVQTIEKTYTSNSDATHAVRKLVDSKISKGYQYLDESKQSRLPDKTEEIERFEEEKNPFELLKRNPPQLFGEDKVTKQVKYEKPKTSISPGDLFPGREDELLTVPSECEIDLTGLNPDQKAKVLEKALKMEVSCSFEGSSVVLKGYQRELEALQIFIKHLKSQNETKEAHKSDEAVTIKIPNKLARQASEIEKYASNLGLICEVKKDRVLVLGEEDQIDTLRAYVLAMEDGGDASLTKSKPQENENEFIQQEMDLTWNQRNQKVSIENKLRETGLFYEFRDGKLYVLGPRKTILEIADFLFSLEKTGFSTGGTYNTNPGLFNNNTNYSTSGLYTRPGLFGQGYTQPSYSGGGSLFNNSNSLFSSNFSTLKHTSQSDDIEVDNIDPFIMGDIKKKGEELGVVAAYLSNSLRILGPMGSKVDEFLSYITEKKNNKNQEAAKAHLDLGGMSAKKSEDEGDFEQKKITLPDFYRGKTGQIQLKAHELGLLCDFEGNIVLVAGTPSNIHKFEKALAEMGEKSNKELYPKYWDFNVRGPFAKIQLMPGSLEYQEIAGKFMRKMEEGVSLLSIRRVQNSQLMDLYINNIQQRMQHKPLIHLDRRLLFNSHDDEDREGFDDGDELSQVPAGGIYFSSNAASVVSDRAFDDGRPARMFLCDVFVGRYESDRKFGSHLPPGYDSVQSGEFFILHDRFQSYPLYQIDYKVIEEEDDGYDDDEEDMDSDGYY